MKKIARFLTLALAMSLMFAFSAQAEQPAIKIGIIQLVQHPALDASCQGFLDALKDGGYVDGENIAVDFQNGQGDQSNLATIADRFVSNQSDLILAIATPAALAVAGKTTDIPILATAITDFVEARLVESNEVPGTNVSGTTDMAAIDDQIGLIVKLVPEAQTIGVMYNSGEVNSVVQAELAKASIEARGLTYVEVTVTNSNEVQQGAERLMKECDAVYLPTDNVLASSMPIVYGVSVEAKKPVICGESGMVSGGGLATIGINYYNLGYQTGEMAIRLFEDETLDVSAMPIESQTEYDYSINATVAAEIGLTIPDDLVEFTFEME
ncbi:MAG: ABC transporter substrate-binding protein [Oscillospiraceae bacterium]|jgi:putative ABC transport system substrate-binding protein|nr:ABC transporter substrate-binding protein [Oscillospiraceae bacterium]